MIKKEWLKADEEPEEEHEVQENPDTNDQSTDDNEVDHSGIPTKK